MQIFCGDRRLGGFLLALKIKGIEAQASPTRGGVLLWERLQPRFLEKTI
jgi:hypothetical protein